MVDLTQSPIAVVLQLINESNGTAFTAAQVSLGTPAMNDKVINTRNTIITLSSAMNPNTELPVDLTYNRLSLPDLLHKPYCQIPAATPSRIADLLPAINAKYLINLTLADIVDAPYRPTDIVTGIKKVSFSCQATSLIYTGTVTIYLGDADLVDDWFTRPHFQIGSDSRSITFEGNTYTIRQKETIIDPQTVVPINTTVAVYLGVDKVVRTTNQYLEKGQLLANFDHGVLKEVLGPNGESSYDDNGVIKPALPPFPSFLSAIPETLNITGQVANNIIAYSSTYDVKSKAATAGITYYVDGKNGSNANDGSTQAKAFKTLTKALVTSPACRVIRVVGYSDYYYDSTSGWITAVQGRELDIIGIGATPPKFTGTTPVEAWTNQINTVWFTSVSNFGTVVDLTNTDVLNGFARFQVVTSISECQNNTGSYYYDSLAGRLYVNLFDARTPDANVFLLNRNLSGYVSDASSVYLENLNFDLSYTGFIADMTVPRTQGYLYTKNCSFGWTATGPSFASYGFNVIHQNPVAQYGYTGGLSYNSDRALPSMKTAPWVVELNATVNHCGFAGNGASPASAITSNVTAVRFNGIYNDCDGDMVKDSGENTKSFNLGCSVTATKWSNADAAMYAAGANSLTSAQAYYYSCKQDDSGISFYTKGVAKVTLNASPVGAKPCYQRETPYLFAYSE